MKRWMILVGVGVAVLVAAAIVLAALRENPHHVNGLKHIEAKNFDEATEQLRLCLQEEENHLSAKAMLHYATIRQRVEDEEDEYEDCEPEYVKEMLVQGFLSTFARERSEDPAYNVTFLDTEDRKDWQKSNKEWRKQVREEMREAKVYTRDWDEVNAVWAREAQIVSELSVDPDDEYDELFHALALARLAAQGDRQAGEALVKLAKETPELAALLIIARDTVIEPLRKELSNKESLMREDALETLQVFCLDDMIAQFCRQHPKVKRPTRKADFGPGNKLVWEQRRGWTGPAIWPGGNQFYRWFLDTFATGVDLCSIWFDIDRVNDEHDVACVVGYDSAKKRFCARMYLWDDDELCWRDLKIKGENNTTLDEITKKAYMPARVDGFAESSELGISWQEVGEDTYTETVTRYRAERDLWGRSYRVPYKIEVTRERDAIFSRWAIYELEPESECLVFQEETSGDEYFRPSELE